MQFRCMVIAALASIVLAQQDPACPTVTETVLNSGCSTTCGTEDCLFQTTLSVPCGCPAAVPTATLIAPCVEECPYFGCAAEFQTLIAACPSPTSTSEPEPEPTSEEASWTRWWTRTRTWSTTVTSTPTPTPTSTEEEEEETLTVTTEVVTSVVTIGPPETTPCPTVTRTMQPDDCEGMRCPVPTCIERETMTVPCGCEGPETLLLVTGCDTECPTGCATMTETETAACVTGGWGR